MVSKVVDPITPLSGSVTIQYMVFSTLFPAAGQHVMMQLDVPVLEQLKTQCPGPWVLMKPILLNVTNGTQQTHPSPPTHTTHTAPPTHPPHTTPPNTPTPPRTTPHPTPPQPTQPTQPTQPIHNTHPLSAPVVIPLGKIAFHCRMLPLICRTSQLSTSLQQIPAIQWQASGAT